MYDIVKSDDIIVPELLHEGDLSNRSGWCPFIRIEVDFFQGNNFVGGPRLTLVDCSISAFTQLFLL